MMQSFTASLCLRVKHGGLFSLPYNQYGLFSRLGTQYFSGLCASLCVQQHTTRSLFTCVVCSKSFYEALEVRPNATQSQIKEAYYRLSKIYHPDRNKLGGEGAEENFRMINEAYEVLGNTKLRKLYDKGLLHTATNLKGSTFGPEERDEQIHIRQSKRRQATGRTAAYDFDEWTRAHYSETFQRRATAKGRYEDMLATRAKKQAQIHFMFLLSLIIVVVASFMKIAHELSEFDTIKQTPKFKDRVDR